MVKMKTSKLAVFSYKIPHRTNGNPLPPIKSLRREPSDWEMYGMNGKNCLVWVETVMRTDLTATGVGFASFVVIFERT